MDRCRVWESHADLAARRVSKPSPDPIYPAYVVGDSDKISEMKRVAAVTRLKSGPDQLEDLLRRLLAAVDNPAPIPEAPAVEKLLQCLVAETQGRPSPVVSPPARWVWRICSGRSSLDNSKRGAHLGSDPSDGTGTELSVYHAESRVMLRLGARLWMNRFRLCYQNHDDQARLLYVNSRIYNFQREWGFYS